VLLLLPEPDRRPAASATAAATPVQFPLTWVLLTFGIALLSQIVFYLIPVQLPFYLRALVNASASQSGMAIALTTLFSAFTSLLYQRIKSRLSFLSVYGISFLNLALGYALISAATNFGLVLPGLAIAGLGLGLLMPNMSFCLTSIAPEASRGRVLGGLTSSMFLGQFLSPIVSQPLTGQFGLSTTYAIAGGVMALLAAIALWAIIQQNGLQNRYNRAK
jgi:MFS family permease